MTLPVTLPERFEIVEALADTPLERTFHAFDRLVHREVLVRLPARTAWAGWSAPVRERLLREARALAKVQHEGVVPILWVEETAEGPLLVQPLPEGERLTERLRRGPLSVAEAVAIGVGIGRALAAVHYERIVHRGIGPDAVWLLPDGRVRLGSFTFAKGFDARLPSSIDHGRRDDPKDLAVLPPYPAPEQLAGRAADARVDVWAMGCLLWRCITGQDPDTLSGNSLDQQLRAQRTIPRPLGVVLRTCMQMTSTARYPTAQAVVEALESAQGAGGAGSVGARFGGRRALAGAGAGFLLVVAAALWWPSGRVDGAPARVAGGTVQAGGAAAPAEYSDSYRRGHALLVGIAGGYSAGPWDALEGPVREVEQVAERLRANDPLLWNDASIHLLPDEAATKADIDRELETIRREAQPEDAVFVYFAGHGHKLADSSGYWLVAQDAQTRTPSASGTAGFVDCRVLLDLEKYCKAKHVLVVLDCCYAGKLFENLLEDDPHVALRGELPEEDDPVDPRHSRYLTARACQFLVSANVKTPAKDARPGSISDFCRAFLAAISPVSAEARAAGAAPERRLVTAGMVKELIAERVREAQRPLLQTHGDGQFVFFLPPK